MEKGEKRRSEAKRNLTKILILNNVCKKRERSFEPIYI